jgi:hypothetical protein
MLRAQKQEDHQNTTSQTLTADPSTNRTTTTISKRTKTTTAEGKEMSDDDGFDASHFCKNPTSPPQLFTDFKGLTHEELRTHFTKGCKAARPVWECVPRAHQELLKEDGFNPDRMQVWKRCIHYWEEIAEDAGLLVTYENGEVWFCGNKTDQKRTVEEINKRKANRRAGRHITKEEDAKQSKEDGSQSSSPKSKNSEMDANKKGKVVKKVNSKEVISPEDEDDDDDKFTDRLYKGALIESTAEARVENNAYTDIDLQNTEDLFYGKGGDNDFKNVEHNLILFKRMDNCFDRVVSKSKEILDTAQMSNKPLKVSL